MLKTHKTYEAAHKAAKGLPIVRLRGLYITGFDDLLQAKLTQVEVIQHEHGVVAQIGLGHLNRLGNGNYAEPNERWKPRVNIFEHAERDFREAAIKRDVKA